MTTLQQAFQKQKDKSGATKMLYIFQKSENEPKLQAVEYDQIETLNEKYVLLSKLEDIDLLPVFGSK